MAFENILLVQAELSQHFNVPATSHKSQLLKELAVSVNHLITNDFAGLLNILYRLDISEQAIKNSLKQNESEYAGMLIATLIVERQIQKQKTREAFRSSSKNIPDDDKW